MNTYAVTLFGHPLSYGELALIAVCILLSIGLVALAWAVRQMNLAHKAWIVPETYTRPMPTQAQLDEYFRDRWRRGDL